MRVAALDCGTNSLRLLVSDVEAGAARDVVRRMEVVRLGEGVDRTGRFSAEALRRTLSVTAAYARTCRELDVERVRFVATSASRDVANREELYAGVQQALDAPAEVIDGLTEARLSFRGATAGLADLAGRTALVVDIGGGSTELVRGRADVEASISVDIGCVRLTERHAVGERLDPRTRALVQSDVDAALERAFTEVVPGGSDVLVGLAGTVTTVTAHALRLDRYDSEVLHAHRSTPAELVVACEELAAASRAERARLPFMHPGRVDVIAVGALIWAGVLRRAEAVGVRTVLTSEHDILDGIALDLAAQPRP